MINNITSMDFRPQMQVAKPMPSMTKLEMPPILGFKTPFIKEKATIKVKKIKRGDNIIIPGEIDDNYVDIVEEDVDDSMYLTQALNARSDGNFFATPELLQKFGPRKQKVKYLKNCYIIDYIQSPKPRNGLGTIAIKQLAEKAMFDERADGRIVTFSSPVVKESSPAMFFYKLGFRFTDSKANEYMEDCLRKKIPDIPAQIGMMYLPKNRLQKLLRYGELF